MVKVWFYLKFIFLSETATANIAFVAVFGIRLMHQLMCNCTGPARRNVTTNITCLRTVNMSRMHMSTQSHQVLVTAKDIKWMNCIIQMISKPNPLPFFADITLETVASIMRAFQVNCMRVFVRWNFTAQLTNHDTRFTTPSNMIRNTSFEKTFLALRTFSSFVFLFNVIVEQFLRFKAFHALWNFTFKLLDVM